eukprot:CAMPEP_0206225414 /NCGR_PEP_ID=MMETSP0047_2-20121206/7535_1 /ASSEMBLY_ACC=CAM_ASM_000192 /TAXON_ID=195065 /ORGANISM="Chroomonas mesostigmatica_cf, Strain CCMP1168" /LENGTH=104 /DNA_ID=CAMNT_0053648413 /DNA_START=22 /DNA_END=336 /DNA_ORIENTATION=+
MQQKAFQRAAFRATAPTPGASLPRPACCFGCLPGGSPPLPAAGAAACPFSRLSLGPPAPASFFSTALMGLLLPWSSMGGNLRLLRTAPSYAGGCARYCCIAPGP